MVFSIKKIFFNIFKLLLRKLTMLRYLFLFLLCASSISYSMERESEFGNPQITSEYLWNKKQSLIHKLNNYIERYENAVASEDVKMQRYYQNLIKRTKEELVRYDQRVNANPPPEVVALN